MATATTQPANRPVQKIKSKWLIERMMKLEMALVTNKGIAVLAEIFSSGDAT